MEKISIGRASECMLNIPESFPRVSNEHADIHFNNGILTYYDHSSNGTIINGQNIHNSSKEIHPGDQILLAGSFELSWTEIERFFPNLHRATERFDGTQVDIGMRKTETFNDFNSDNNRKQTEQFVSSDDDRISSQTTEMIHSGEERSQIRGQLNEFTQAEIEELTEKWNVGAFLSSWVWALANRIYWPLLIIPISLVPYIGQVASLFLCTYLGLKGNRLAWAKTKDHDFKKFVSRQKKWVVIGIFLFILFSAVQAFTLYIDILNLYYYAITEKSII